MYACMHMHVAITLIRIYMCVCDDRIYTISGSGTSGGSSDCICC